MNFVPEFLSSCSNIRGYRPFCQQNCLTTNSYAS